MAEHHFNTMYDVLYLCRLGVIKRGRTISFDVILRAAVYMFFYNSDNKRKSRHFVSSL